MLRVHGVIQGLMLLPICWTAARVIQLHDQFKQSGLALTREEKDMAEALSVIRILLPMLYLILPPVQIILWLLYYKKCHQWSTLIASNTPNDLSNDVNELTLEEVAKKDLPSVSEDELDPSEAANRLNEEK